MAIENSRKAALDDLGCRIVSCKKCPRLVKYTRRIAKTKTRRYRDWDYWGRPIPGFGDSNAKLLIIGLAPAAHGGNRTGRMFTGDSSGEWLMRALHEIGFSNQPITEHRDDGLKLYSTYLTAVLRCAPPANRPLNSEVRNCSEYLAEELKLLDGVKAVLALGKIAFDAYLEHIGGKVRTLRLRFRHGAFYKLNDDLPILAVSYHPSRQNTQTRKLTWDMWIKVFRKVHSLMYEE